MADVANLLPARRAELVSWPAGTAGWYHLRNHRTGESFQFGKQEHFLLERLDGRHPVDEICRLFQDRFGESLSAGELEGFVRLAASRGLLVRPSGDVIALSPPLIVEAGQIDRIFTTLAAAIRSVD